MQENKLKEINIMEVGGFKVGHAQDYQGMTGCTVILCDQQAPAGVDIRGGGPASRETPLLTPVQDAKGIHALLLSGGSAFGLDAAGGVMRYLEERGIGYDVGVTKVPLVTQSCVFDLAIGDVFARPDQKMGYEACEHASYEAMEEGCVGAGTGCTVGKYRGPQFMMKSGIGSYAVSAGELKVGAIVAVNALGDIHDIESGAQIAGLKDAEGNLFSTELEMWKDMDMLAQMKLSAEELEKKMPPKQNTTIGAVLTNAKMDKTLMNKVASMAHNGYARTIRPVHTTADGDSIYALSLGQVEANVNIVGTLGAYVMGKAIDRAVAAVQACPCASRECFKNCCKKD